MKIDRSNYEIWLIDLLDGNLSERQAEELKSFLEMNPELKEEFDEISSVSLKPAESTFLNKDNLKKLSADLPESQFEYLCVAYLENDLSDNQRDELMQIVGQDSEKKKSFELILKAKITPEAVSYKHKNKLIKKPPVLRVIRMPAGWLSAAAVAILVTAYLLIPRNLTDKTDYINSVSALITPVDNSIAKPTVNNITEGKAITPVQKRNLLAYETEKKTIVPSPADPSINAITDSMSVDVISRETEFTKIAVLALPYLKGEALNNTLIANNSSFIIPYYDEERSNIGRFIARNFREKFLREKSSSDSPLKAYEIAEAGVAGLNKLLGWEMALDEKNDANGELQSVYFSSKMLKFNTPVKKTEPLP